MESYDFIAMNNEYVFNTYGRTPVMLVEGAGCKVTDSNGRTYLDFIGGLAACCLGHGHEALAQAISEQAKKLIHVSNLFYIEPQIKLAKLLTENSFAEKVFFCNSGAEANEGSNQARAKILSRSRGASTLSDHYYGGIVPWPNPRHVGCHGPNEIQAGFRAGGSGLFSCSFRGHKGIGAIRVLGHGSNYDRADPGGGWRTYAPRGLISVMSGNYVTTLAVC